MPTKVKTGNTSKLQALASLQPASAQDAEDLAALRVDVMRPSLEQVGRFDPQRARDRFLAGFCAADTRHVVVGGKRVGVVVVRCGEGQQLLDHFYIASEHQGQGLGAFVLGIVLAEADAQGQPVSVTALKLSAANRFYMKHGFLLVDQTEWDNHYVRRVPAGA